LAKFQQLALGRNTTLKKFQRIMTVLLKTSKLKGKLAIFQNLS